MLVYQRVTFEIARLFNMLIFEEKKENSFLGYGLNVARSARMIGRRMIGRLYILYIYKYIYIHIHITCACMCQPSLVPLALPQKEHASTAL